MRMRRFGFLLSILMAMVLLAAVLPAAPVMAAGTISIATVPATAPPAGPVGTVVTVTSTANFTPGAGATFSVRIDSGVIVTGTLTGAGAIPAAPATGSQFTVPALPVGTHQVSVVTSTGDTSPNVPFVVTPSLTATPALGQVGNTVLLTGNGFSAGATVTTYWDATTTIGTTTTTAAGSFTISFTVPQSAAGGHTLTTTDAFGYSATFFGFTVTPSTTLNSSTVTVGSQMTISGAGYAPSSSISIKINGALVASTLTNVSGSFSYNLTVPSTVRGAYTLTISDASFNVVTTGFTVNSAVSITPSSFTSGSTVNISGSGFAASSAISSLIDGNVVNATAATTDSLGGFTITGYTVPKLPGGSHTLQVTDASGNTGTVAFSVAQAIAIAPTSGISGTNVQVTGGGFSANSTITISFDGANVNPSTIPQTDSTGAFSASFAVPAASGGNHQVMASDGTFSSSAVFGVTSRANISPVTGPVGTAVTATGNSFASKGSISITFDSAPVATVMADNAGSFNTTFSVPQSATGTRPVIITDGTRSATFSFAVTPSVTVTPATGYVGTSVTVKGTGFTGNGQISIRYDATQFTTTSANSVGSFTVIFNAPASKGGNHSIIVSDSVNTVTATFSMDSTPPPMPALSLPLNGTKENALGEFQWGDVTDPNGITYEFQISRNQNFSVLILEKTGLTSSGYQLTAQEKLRSASRSKPYYWRVRAIDAASNESAWSPAQSFYVGFVLPSWVMYVIFAVVVVLAFLAGMWLGGRRRISVPPAA